MTKTAFVPPTQPSQSAPPHHGKPAHAAPPADHKSAIAKMHPEHLHRLVQDAHAGKFGPDAQKTAQQAMQPQAPPQEAPQQAPPNGKSSIFSGGDDMGPAAPAAGPSRSSIFSGGM